MYAERPRLGALGSIAQELARLFILRLVEMGGGWSIDTFFGSLLPLTLGFDFFRHFCYCKVTN
jgi:hypothetical protein